MFKKSDSNVYPLFLLHQKHLIGRGVTMLPPSIIPGRSFLFSPTTTAHTINIGFLPHLVIVMLRNQAFQTRFSTIPNVQVLTQPLIGTPEDDDALWKSCSC